VYLFSCEILLVVDITIPLRHTYIQSTAVGRHHQSISNHLACTYSSPVVFKEWFSDQHINTTWGPITDAKNRSKSDANQMCIK
jgi:hypothetical protein